MNRVWKVASRWSETGTAESSILDIFRRHNVVFVGKFQDRFQQIEVGDLIAISDAKRVVAMGLAMSLPKPVSELGIEFTDDDLSKFDREDHVLGCRVSFSDLGEEEQPSYRVSTFHSVNERADEFRRIFTAHRQRFEERQQFEINARSCTLACNSTSAADVLWQEGLVFRVPVYQRAYSWKEGEVRRLLGDLLANYLGMNGRPVEEPMFIGTMQLTKKRLLDGTNGTTEQEVIDGQQRLSTLLLLLNILKGRCPELPVWTGLDIANRMVTAVSSGEQQRYLREAIEADLRNLPEETQNPYLHVVPLIQQLLDEATADNGEDEKSAPSAPLDVGRFTAYLLSRVYFVVIETRATLSKTLQIFDAINTSGMDLNGGDVFKVRYYEYLRVTQKVKETEFERISRLYQAIDERNRAAGQTICGIEEILSLVRHILVARYELPRTLHDYGASIFFDRFFDTVLSINNWPNFTLATCRRTDVQLEEFERLIAVRFDWSKVVPALSPEAGSMLDFIIRWSRYSKYDYLIVLFRDRFGADLALTERFIIQLAKLLVIFSIIYWKAVYELHGILHRAVGMMFDPASVSTAEDVIECLRKLAADKKRTIEVAFHNDPIADNVRAKNLACRLAAFLHELEEGILDAKQMRSLIFDTELDIEHIESVNHKDELERARVHALWQGELHQIGNLIVLESSLNRSISNEDYKTVKVPAYRTRSAFRTVRIHAEEFPSWNLEMCKERKEKLKRTLVDYLCQ
ncbi:MAG TPA: DUF262 domain-containing HNH endonuclease family protein [Opitutaceae bacterium]|nr:DUF262 domain-containing HNH endonuclease family protein [Opitutaceae bacterium]